MLREQALSDSVASVSISNQTPPQSNGYRGAAAASSVAGSF